MWNVFVGLAPPKTSPGLMTAEARPNGQWTSVPVNPNLNGPV